MDFERYVRERQRALFRFAVVLTGDRTEAEDLLSDVLSVAFEKWSLVQAADNSHAYVRRMLVNAFVRSRRRGARSIAHADVEVFADPIADHSVEHAQRDWLVAQMRKLPPRQRAAVVLRYYERLSISEIAAELGTGENAVRSNLSRALGRLRLELSVDAEPTEHLMLEV
jgi:RNA polymerase sigma-70 factor (sigma-E family)